MAVIHGGLGREERRKAQERFLHDITVQVLLATDAASEGINLQRAHLMVNYDLPWNPNRLEQRFGRIHRIGQTEVCHLWNLVAEETREGDVYRKLLEKIEEARRALGGQVFDVLGKLQFEGKPLRDLLIQAIRYGEQPEVRARLTQAIEEAVDRPSLEELMDERALATEFMDTSRVATVREDMERAQARRLQPHYIEEFFREAFMLLGGTLRQREPRRYEIRHVARADPPPRPHHWRGPTGAPTLRARGLREGSHHAARATARGVHLPRPPAARRDPRPDPRATPRPAPARRHPRRRPRSGYRAADALLRRACDPGRQPAAFR